MTGVVEPQDWVTGGVAVTAAVLLFGLPAAAALWHMLGVRLGLVGDDPAYRPVMASYRETRSAGTGKPEQKPDLDADTGVIAVVPAAPESRVDYTTADLDGRPVEEQVRLVNAGLPHPAGQDGDWLSGARSRPTPVTVAVGAAHAALRWRTEQVAQLTSDGAAFLARAAHRRASVPVAAAGDGESGRHRKDDEQ